MTERSTSITSTIAFAIAAISFGFSIGLWVQESRCSNDVAVLRAQFIAHQNLLIHPGAATSEVVQALELRVRELEQAHARDRK